MICDRCGVKLTQKAARVHPDICPKRPRRRRRPPTSYKRGREGVMSPAEAAELAPKRWAQLDLFEQFVDRGRFAQAAVDAIIGKKARRHG